MTSFAPINPNDPSLDTLIAARAKLSYIMIKHNRPQFAPILRRLNAEIEALNDQEAAMDLARQYLRDT